MNWQLKKLETLRKKKGIRYSQIIFKYRSEFRCCELFAKPAKKGLPSPDHQDNYY